MNMYKLNNIIHNERLDLLIGSILGDPHIGKSGNLKPFIIFEQTYKQKDYVLDINQKVKNAGLDLYEIKH